MQTLDQIALALTFLSCAIVFFVYYLSKRRSRYEYSLAVVAQSVWLGVTTGLGHALIAMGVGLLLRDLLNKEKET